MAINAGSISYQLGVDTSGLNKASKQVTKFQSNTTKSFDKVGSSAKKLGAVIGVIITGVTIRNAVKLADSYALLGDRLKSIEGNADKATLRFKQLEAISARTGASLDTTIGGFQKLSFASETVGATSKDMVELTSSFANLGLVSGTSSELMNAAMLQFSQGLVTGTFQAQEFQSVLENVPAIAPEIAAGMGITVEKLIQMKKEGKLVSEEVFRALLARTDEIAKKAADMPVRLDRGVARLKLGGQQMLGTFDEIFPITQKIGKAFFEMGEFLSEVPIFLAAISRTEAFKQLIDSAEKFGKVTKDITGTLGNDIAVQLKIAASGAELLFTVIKESIDSVVSSVGVLGEAIQKSIFLDFSGVDTLYEDLTEKIKGNLQNIKDAHAQNNADIAELNKQFSEQAGGEGGGIGAMSVDLSELDVIRDFNDQVIQLRDERYQGLEELRKKYAASEINSAKKTYDILLETEKWFENSKASFKDKANKTETQKAGENFKSNIAAAANSSKEFFALNKALTLADLAIKTPQAIGDAYTYGTSIGGPALGVTFAGVAGASMAVQAAAAASQTFTPRAIGGDIFPNQIYKVNENGPEMFNFGGSDFLATGNNRGFVTPAGRGGSGAVKNDVIVNIHNKEGQTAKMNRKQTSEGVEIDVIIESIDEQIASGIRSGLNRTSEAMTEVFGLNRAQGAFV